MTPRGRLATAALALAALTLSLAGCAPKGDASTAGPVTGRWTATVSGGTRVYRLVVRAGGLERVVPVRHDVYRACRTGSRWPDCAGGVR